MIRGIEGKTNENRFLIPILSLIIVVLIFFVGFALGRAGFNVAFENGDVNYTFKGRFYPEEKEIDFDLFWQVWDLVDQTYVDKAIDDQDRFYGAIKGSVAALGDRATQFLTPEEYEDYKKYKGGFYQGIGIQMGYFDNEVIIKRIFPETPAEQSELIVGDIIRKVDDTNVSGASSSEIADKILGEKGTKVKLSIFRPSDDGEYDFELERDEVYYASAWWEEIDDGIIQITLIRFTESDFTEFANVWDSVIAEVAETNPKAVILDLRGNGGGYLDGAVHVAGDFLKKGNIVLYVEDREGIRTPMEVQKDGALLDIPLVVLVDQDTASASEIFAGALQYYDRGLVLGEETFGKGTAQEIIPLVNSGGASIKITIEKWLLPDKQWVNPENPIVPDISVDLGIDEFKNGDDPQLERAIQELSK